MPIQTSTVLKSRASRTQPFLALGCLLAACTLPAATFAADNPGAHEHGHARLQLAIEKNSIDLMLTSPAYNLAGFEHEARTNEERNRLAEIKQWLNTTPLVNVDDASCRITAAAVELGGEDTDDTHGHDHHGDDEKASHREYDVSQQLQCQGMGANREFRSALMEKFENLEELTVEWVSQSGQGSARLTPSNRAFTVSH
ncbi:DUF2796 domain-containing protein [Marinobacter panjinensis]|uniref:DUF2796 domain-containing protein n=1 Tax=Marinobacter panjinensis TaxID=2576384 RepID=A0A4U6R418_9GAMM|nr:DUF2796 domain-containing protein [Marinobacter panjinensis]MCR8916108.1 DUF2796 domain-containing protein [Marinobacter panjinensis]TKV68410.1 DUF2796 domain-containing protein [Marinobacter panjinensis]